MSLRNTAAAERTCTFLCRHRSAGPPGLRWAGRRTGSAQRRHPLLAALRHRSPAPALAATPGQRRSGGGHWHDRTGRGQRLEGHLAPPPAKRATATSSTAAKYFISNGQHCDLIVLAAKDPDPAGGMPRA